MQYMDKEIGKSQTDVRAIRWVQSAWEMESQPSLRAGDYIIRYCCKLNITQKLVSNKTLIT